MSRQVDALVAEHVMGWTKARVTPINGGPKAVAITPGMEWATVTPHFSTEIAPAFEVVENMRVQGWTVQTISSGHEEFAHVHIYQTKPYEGDPTLRVVDKDESHTADAPTLPLAICLAALRAHGITPASEPTPAAPTESDGPASPTEESSE